MNSLRRVLRLLRLPQLLSLLQLLLGLLRLLPHMQEIWPCQVHLWWLIRVAQDAGRCRQQRLWRVLREAELWWQRRQCRQLVRRILWHLPAVALEVGGESLLVH